MKGELQTLIRALEADAFNVSAESMSVRSQLLDNARALDTLDEEQLSRAVAMARETFEKMPPWGEDGQLASTVLALLNGETLDEEIEDEDDEEIDE